VCERVPTIAVSHGGIRAPRASTALRNHAQAFRARAALCLPSVRVAYTSVCGSADVVGGLGTGDEHHPSRRVEAP
jgi:hypothetical protein